MRDAFKIGIIVLIVLALIGAWFAFGARVGETPSPTPVSHKSAAQVAAESTSAHSPATKTTTHVSTSKTTANVPASKTIVPIPVYKLGSLDPWWK